MLRRVFDAATPAGLYIPGTSASKHRPPAQSRKRLTDSPAVTATGTTFFAASSNDTSNNAANRQQLRISAPVQSFVFGFGLDGKRGMKRFVCACLHAFREYVPFLQD